MLFLVAGRAGTLVRMNHNRPGRRKRKRWQASDVKQKIVGGVKEIDVLNMRR